MSMISVYVDGTRYTVEDSQYLMARANQAIQTLESYKKRLRSVLSSLSALEIESNVSLGDVAMTLQRMEMVNRIIREVSHYVLELGVHGRLIALQLEELRAPEMTASDLILRDYLPEVNDELITAGVEATSEPGRYGHRGSAHDCPHRRLWREPRPGATPAASRFPPACRHSEHPERYF